MTAASRGRRAGRTLGAMVLASSVWAAAPARAEDPRPWKAVLDDAIAAMGGRDVLARRKSLHEKVTVTLVAQNMSGTVETWAARGDKALRITNLKGIPEAREGTDGRVAWSQDAVNGLRVLEGVEKEQARLETAWMAELRLPKLFGTITSSRETGPHGEEMECLTLAARAKVKGAELPPLVNCYDGSTHLQVLQRGKHLSPEGELPFTTEYADYREVGGIKLAFLMTTTMGPIRFTASTEEAIWDEPTTGLAFGLPKVPHP